MKRTTIERHRWAPERAINVWDLGSTSIRHIAKAPRDPSVLNVLTKILRDSSNHFWNSRKASFDEMTFIGCAETYGPQVAMQLAAQFGWKCQRLLRALRTLQKDRARSYRKRERKTRKPATRRKASS